MGFSSGSCGSSFTFNESGHLRESFPLLVFSASSRVESAYFGTHLVVGCPVTPVEVVDGKGAVGDVFSSIYVGDSVRYARMVPHARVSSSSPWIWALSCVVRFQFSPIVVHNMFSLEVISSKG